MTEIVIRVQHAKSVPGVAVVTLGGPIDPKNVIDLEQVIERAHARGFHTFVINLERVRYINSMGLAYLVSLSDTLAIEGGALHLANAQPKVKVVFDLMGVSQYFKLHATVAAALKRLSARAPAKRRSVGSSLRPSAR